MTALCQGSKNLFDQKYFIKEIKKIAGVAPNELSKNNNPCFILFVAIRQKWFCCIRACRRSCIMNGMK